ncbi:MAG: AMP-binding protein [Opitutales bacterium]|nr:AMP-binding protein [Opitutales bacterium]
MATDDNTRRDDTNEKLSLTRFGAEGDTSAILAFGAVDEPETWDYARLEELVGRLAAGLRGNGVEAGERVALIAPTSPAYVAVALAIVRAGAVVVPVDAQMGDEGLAHILEDAALRHIFTDKRGEARLEKLDLDVEKRPALHRIDGGADDEGSWLALQADEPLGPEERDAGETAVQFYTSGTTGAPKGVPLTRRNVHYQFEVAEKTGLIQSGDRLLLPLPLHHVYPFVVGTLAPLYLGLSLVFPSALTGPQIARAVRDAQVSVIFGVPRLHRALVNGIREKAKARGSVAWTLFRAMLGMSRLGDRLGLQLGKRLFGTIHRNLGGRVRIMASGGSPLDASLARDLRAFGWDVVIGYGLTETSPLLTILDAREPRFDSVGRVVPGTEVKIDPAAAPGAEEGGAESKPGDGPEKGEVMARGPGVFRGYFNLPEATEKALEGEWFRTGDLGWFDKDGLLHLEGRVGTMLVSEGGENIAPEILEDAYGEAPEIDEAGVLQKDGKLVAVIVPESGTADDKAREAIAEAVTRIGKKRPSYQRLSEFRLSDRPLPRTRLGKIKRHELKTLYESGGKTGGDDAAAAPVEVGEMSSSDQALLEEERARALWDFLAERFSDHRLEPDSRLETDLGLDSIGWVELAGSVEERLGISFGEELMERASKVRDLLEAAADTGKEGGGSDFRAAIRDPESVLSASELRWARPRSKVREVVAFPVYWILKAFTKVWFRTEIEGLENLPEKGPFVLTPNHVSYLDAPVLGLAFRYPVSRSIFWAGLGTLMLRNVIFREISRLSQVVPVDPRRGPVSSLALGAAVLKEGQPLVWFPEGGRSEDGELRPFRSGVGLILLEYHPPVIPVHIEGTRESMPVGALFPRPAKVVIRIGKPLDARQLAESAEGDTPQERVANGLREAVGNLAGPDG